MIQRAVVTGAAGFIGNALCKRLQELGTHVLAVDLVPPSCAVPFQEGDVREPGLLDPWLCEQTHVFHMAAHASVAGSVKDPQHDFEVNVVAFLEVLESARRAGASVVFPSSAAVFDGRQPLPHAEQAPKRPVSPYGAAKLACEAYCHAFHQCYGLDVKIARLFNVYGEGMTRFAIYDMTRKLMERPDYIQILGDGNQLRDYLHMDDLVDGLLLIADRGAAGEDYNLATGRPISSSALAQLLASILGCDNVQIDVTHQSFPGDIPRWYADISKVQQLGFEVRVPLEEGLRRTVQWLQQVSAEQTRIEV